MWSSVLSLGTITLSFLIIEERQISSGRSRKDKFLLINIEFSLTVNSTDSISIKHIYREQNKRADQLANMALDK